MTGNPPYKIYLLSYEPHGGAVAEKRRQFAEVVHKFPGWAKYFKSTWLLATRESAREIWRSVEPHVTDQDYILIIEAGNDYYGALPQKGWEWFNSIRSPSQRRT